MRETAYQRKLIEKLESLLPGCVIIKNDPRFTQGIPDLLVLFNNMWAMLEVKLSNGSRKRPNQEYYVGHFNEMSFASFIHPDNEEEVLGALQSAFRSKREARVPQSK